MRLLFAKFAGVALALLVALGAGARAARAGDARMPAKPAKIVKPSDAIDPASCVTRECHANIKSFKVLHTPINANACDACHEVKDVKEHTFQTPRTKTAMCTYCHEFDVEGIPVVHDPVARGDCTGCHDPHGGTDSRILREESVKQTCNRCHEDDASLTQKHAHEPVASGSCESCHTAHASRFPKLLFAEGDALCISCHQDFQVRLADVRFRHGAMKEGCAACHTPHTSKEPKLMREPVVALCTSCHEKTQRDAMQSKYGHSVVTTDRACLTCHTPHGSDLAALMSDTPLKVCMSCHDQKVKTARGYVVSALPELKDATTIRHGPIRDGQCGTCHQVHGSDQPALLARSNSNKFYQALAPENYKLCFTCHDTRLATQEKTTIATMFRNGQQNLHFLHVNDGSRGRNCRVCHSTHASHSPQHVNETVQYGKWALPISFKKTATGGSCVRSCHPAYEYDREKPVPLPTSATTRPSYPPFLAPGVERASSAAEKPPVISLSLTSASGAPIRVPDGNRPTVLLLTRPGQAQQEQLLALVGAGVPDAHRAQVILVLGGATAADEAKRVATKKLPWPIVPDSTDAVFDRLQVHVWPTVLIIRSDGVQAARVSGTPQSLSAALAAYIDFADAKIDRATLAQRLSAQTTLGDSPARKAARDIQAAERLLSAGDATRARQTLEEALSRQSGSAPLCIELAKVLTIQGDTRHALDMLDRIPDDTLPPGKKDVLRARALIAGENWDQAEKALQSALSRDASNADAHYLIGRIYEHAQNWPLAAREYRAARDAGGGGNER